ncbi:MAG: hypothetical protein WDW38_006485 [Sanguina aurantia]
MLITGVDLVREQLLIAGGEDVARATCAITGHDAATPHQCAEDPDRCPSPPSPFTRRVVFEAPHGGQNIHYLEKRMAEQKGLPPAIFDRTVSNNPARDGAKLGAAVERPLRPDDHRCEPADRRFDARGAARCAVPGVGELPLWPVITLNALFDAGTDRRGLIETLSELLAWLEPAQVVFRDVADQDWERAWMDQFKPMPFGPRRRRARPASRLGGGSAGAAPTPTTALCLEWLDGLELAGQSIIDYGCGSGILAIAALKLGAAQGLGGARQSCAQALMRLGARCNARGRRRGRLAVWRRAARLARCAPRSIDGSRRRRAAAGLHCHAWRRRPRGALARARAMLAPGATAPSSAGICMTSFDSLVTLAKTLPPEPFRELPLNLQGFEPPRIELVIYRPRPDEPAIAVRPAPTENFSQLVFAPSHRVCDARRAFAEWQGVPKRAPLARVGPHAMPRAPTWTMLRAWP